MPLSTKRVYRVHAPHPWLARRVRQPRAWAARLHLGRERRVAWYAYDPTRGEFPGQPGPQGGQGQPAARGAVIASNDRETQNGMPGAMLSVSADGRTAGSGIVWASFPPYNNANRQTVLGSCARSTRRDSTRRGVWSLSGIVAPTHSGITTGASPSSAASR
jgi:hypothetical protein